MAGNSERDDLVGTTIGGRWVVDEVIGQGGMGTVYRVHHDVIGKPMALKLLHHKLTDNEELMARFLLEAQAASTINSEHVVDVVDFGQMQSRPYLVMEYVPGNTLGEVLRDGPVPMPLIYDLAIGLATGLRDAHAAHVIHRDVKPDNVAIVSRDDGTFSCKLLDFGIAKIADASLCAARITAPGAVMGTPHYMAPEQATGSDIDARSDIYALGMILYEMVTGFVPFNSDNLQEVINGHLFHKAAPVRALAPECPEALANVIARCIEKSPYDRFDNMGAVRDALIDAREQAADLDTHGTSLVPTVRPIAPARRTIAVSSRWRLMRHAVIGTAIGAASTVAVWLHASPSNPQATADMSVTPHQANAAPAPASNAASAPTSRTRPSTAPSICRQRKPTWCAPRSTQPSAPTAPWLTASSARSR